MFIRGFCVFGGRKAQLGWWGDCVPRDLGFIYPLPFSLEQHALYGNVLYSTPVYLTLPYLSLKPLPPRQSEKNQQFCVVFFWRTAAVDLPVSSLGPPRCVGKKRDGSE